MVGDTLNERPVSTHEPEEVYIFKAKCKACTIRIGHGYYDSGIFYDILNRRIVCGGCARTNYWSDDYDEDNFIEITSREEVHALTIPQLNTILNERIQGVERDRRPNDPPKRGRGRKPRRT